MGNTTIGTHITRADATGFQNFILGQEMIEFIDGAGQALKCQLTRHRPLGRCKVAADTPEAHVIAHHAAAGHGLKQVDNQVALGDEIQGWGKEGPKVVEQETENYFLLEKTLEMLVLASKDDGFQVETKLKNFIVKSVTSAAAVESSKASNLESSNLNHGKLKLVINALIKLDKNLDEILVSLLDVDGWRCELGGPALNV